MRKHVYAILGVVLLGMSVFSHWQTVEADRLRFTSDLITMSAPSLPADHTITFTTVFAIPADGAISLDFATGVQIPTSDFNHLDIDFLYATTATSVESSFVQRDLATTSSATEDGVTVTTGSTTPAIRIDLNSTTGIPAGATIMIRIGTNARYQAIGNTPIINPSFPGFAQMSIITRDAGNTPIDSNIAGPYIIPQVGVGAERIDVEPPIVTVVYPSVDELIQGGTQSVEIAIVTNEPADCRIGTTSSTTYASIPNTMTAVNQAGTSSHTYLLASTTDSTSYEFFIRCEDLNGNTHATDTVIRFSIGEEQEPGSSSSGSTSSGGGSTSSSGGSTSGGSSSSGGGSSDDGDDEDDSDSSDGGPYLEQSTVTFSGWSFPNREVILLQDGEEIESTNANSQGEFDFEVPDLNRGTYTFGLYAEDTEGLRSGTYTTTIAVRADSEIGVTNIVIQPTVNVDPVELDPGDILTVFGYSVNESIVKVMIRDFESTVSEGVITATTTTDTSGFWQFTVDTSTLLQSTYEVTAQSTLVVAGASSAISPGVLVGVGEAPQGDLCPRADIDKNDLVNLTDFSILVFNWGTTDPLANINSQGVVDLTDFSILLFCWTG